MKQFLLAFGLLLGMTCGGCQKPASTAAMEKDWSAPTASADKPKGDLGKALAFWTWFGPKPDAAQGGSVYLDDASGKKKGVLESLAFWTWFGPKSDALDMDGQPAAKKGILESLAFWNWGKDDGFTEKDALRNFSPELRGRSETPGQFRMRSARTVDTNMRSMQEDIRKALLLDRPSRGSLSPTP